LKQTHVKFTCEDDTTSTSDVEPIGQSQFILCTRDDQQTGCWNTSWEYIRDGQISWFSPRWKSS